MTGWPERARPNLEEVRVCGDGVGPCACAPTVPATPTPRKAVV